MATRRWQDEIRRQLIDMFQDSVDDLAILLTFLDNQPRANPEEATTWTTLRAVWELRAQQLLRAYANDIIRQERARRLNNDGPIVQAIGNSNAQAHLADMDFQVNLPTILLDYLRNHEGTFIGFGAGLSEVWDNLPKEIVACLLVVKLGVNVSRWYNDEISGKRCAQLCVDFIGECGGAFLGAVGGAALGAMMNPFIGAFMAAFGAVLGGSAAKALFNRLTSLVFNLPKDVAVENAYRYLELNHHATQKQIGKVYNARTVIINNVERDPQKRAERQTLLNIHMSIIQAHQNQRLKIE